MSSVIWVKWEVSHIFFCIVHTKKVVFYEMIGQNPETWRLYLKASKFVIM